MKKYGFALGLVIFSFFACKTVKTVTTEVTNQEICKPIVKDTSGIYANSDEFLLVGAVLTGKCLEIEVEYSGGCGGDEWTLVWNGTLMKSLPPKANIFLHLKDNDACREVVRKKVSFDVSSIYNNMEVVLFLKDFRGDLRFIP